MAVRARFVWFMIPWVTRYYSSPLGSFGIPSERVNGVSLRFGECEVDFEARRLTRNGEAVHLAPKAFRLLELMVERRPRVVSKSEIHDALWPDTFVSESSVARLAAELRAALGDRSKPPRLLRTVHGLGYAFVGVVEGQGAPPRPASALCRLVRGDTEVNLSSGVHLIGRGDDVAVRIDSAKVSRQHARVVVTDRTASVEDLGSKNGTFVRGRRITGAVELTDGDEICVGPVLLVFRLSSAGGSTETATT